VEQGVERAQPAVEPIPLAELRAWIAPLALLLALAYLVGTDQGELSRAGLFLHELMHDGRHVLGLPCD
jgi:hypothetical protein